MRSSSTRARANAPAAGAAADRSAPATGAARAAAPAQRGDEAGPERLRGQAGAADLDVLVGRVERRGDFLGHRRLGEPGVALDAIERAAEDDLRDGAPDVGERGPGLAASPLTARAPPPPGPDG